MQFSVLAESGSRWRNMDGHGEMGLLPENFDLGLIGRIRDDGYESRSGSDNFEGGSGEEPDAGDNPRPRKKKYHRHTPNQIQELESFFKECPHPDEKQRSELSKRLSLENKQVKFWFQNRRTQMKTQLERHENIILRQENDKLRAENNMIKDAISSPMCNQCGGPAIPGQISFEEHQIRIENARLRDELNRICALATKFLGRPLSSMAAPIPLPNPSNGFGSGFCSMPVGLDGLSFAPQSMMKPLFPPPTMLGMNNANEVQFERSMLIDLALAAMDEFMKMAQADSPLWNKDPSRGNGESLNFEEYVRSFPPCIGPKPANFASEATRDTSLVSINSLTHVDSLMDANQWTEMFPCLVARAATVEIISTGMGGTRNGALQVMQAELQVLSPLVPVRAVKFLRFCKQHAEGVWAVVDVSVGTSHDASKRLPSGCLIQDMPDGSSKVIWIEHWEYNESGVHEMFRAFMRSGKGFGSQRWLSTLQRQCESLAATNPHDQIGMVELRENGRRSMVKLAKRMVENFCNGVCATSVRRWEKVNVGGVGEDVRVMTRQSVDDPGEPPGTILSAATSVWVPLSHNRLFQFLSDHRLRSDWDILSNDGPMLHMLHIAKGQRMGNHVSLLRAASKTGTTNDNESAMVILQETWSDASGSMVVYAPVDTPSVDVVLSGGDSAYVALLPSGFAILPDQAPPSSFVKGEADVDNNPDGGPGCLLTVGFQILVSSIPTAKINIESVDTVNNLISCTIHKIKAALHIAT